MICLIALVVFGILGIFSVGHRKIAAKAFDCVFRRVTLRPCNSGLDQQLKTGIIVFFSKKNVGAAKFVARHFETLSWVFTVLMLVSIFFSAQGIYYYVLYGNCNGANSDEFCVFDALNPNKDASVCSDPSISKPNATKSPNIDDDPSLWPSDAKVIIIEFGCFSCPYTKKAEPVVKEILQAYGNKILFVYRDFHIPTHPGSEIRAGAAQCANEQEKYWEYRDLLFERQEENITRETLIEMASFLGLDAVSFSGCLDSGRYANETEKDFQDGIDAGVYGTPTFFINKEVVVGPKPFPYFRNIIEKELKK